MNRLDIELKLYFTESEMIEFLKGKGYSVIDEIQTQHTENSYHNKTVTLYHTRTLVYKDEDLDNVKKFVNENEDHGVYLKYGVPFNFRKEVKKIVLSL